MPGYWRNETSGRLEPVIKKYLAGGPLSPYEIVAMRAYLRQWIEPDVWEGDAIADLRVAVGLISSREDIEKWLAAALEVGIDPI
jgi:hypothetical protein